MISGIVMFATVLAATNVESQCKDGTCPADAVPEKPPVADAMPGGAPVTVKVELPRNWDRLMAERVSLFPVWTFGC